MADNPTKTYCPVCERRIKTTRVINVVPARLIDL